MIYRQLVTPKDWREFLLQASAELRLPQPLEEDGK